jgi:glucan 1,3-beta-glucosidase
MDGCPERALDTHIYQAWKDPDSIVGFYTDACEQKDRIAQMETNFGPVIVGEWSLATDNCGKVPMIGEEEKRYSFPLSLPV